MAIEALDTRKAGVWSVIAGVAHLLIAAVGHIAYPYLFTALIAVGFGLLLPAIAVLHPRHGRMRESGAILATIAGNATVTVGLGGSVNADLQPAALFVLGMWWWTIGKIWAETRLLPRELGLATAALGVLAFAAASFSAFGGGLTMLGSGVTGIAAWQILRIALGTWLIVLGVTFWRTASALPSR